MDINLLRKLKPSKQLHIINTKYHKYIKTVIHSCLKIYFGLPETEDDFYWSFMYEVPRLIKEFRGETEKEFTKFLGIKCKFFTFNKCKKLITKPHSVLNNYIPFEDGMLNSRHESSSVLDDSEQSIDFSKHTQELNAFQLQVYKLYFLDGKEISVIIKMLSTSRYMVNKAITAIRKKIQKSINLQDK